MSQELITRWNVFLTKIESRFYESLQQAEQASLELLEENYDYAETMQAFTGMIGAVRNLLEKIGKTWDEKIEDKIEDSGSMYVEGNELESKLLQKLEEFENNLEGKLSKKYYDHSIKIADKDFRCSQCKAKLQINKRIFRSQYIACNYCETVNTFDPETKYVLLGAAVVNNIVKLDLLDEEKALEKTRKELKEKNDKNQATPEDFEKLKTQYLAYHKHYFKERIKLNADYEERFQDDMNRILKQFEKLTHRL